MSSRNVALMHASAANSGKQNALSSNSSEEVSPADSKAVRDRKEPSFFEVSMLAEDEIATLRHENEVLENRLSGLTERHLLENPLAGEFTALKTEIGTLKHQVSGLKDELLSRTLLLSELAALKLRNGTLELKLLESSGNLSAVTQALTAENKDLMDQVSKLRDNLSAAKYSGDQMYKAHRTFRDKVLTAVVDILCYQHSCLETIEQLRAKGRKVSDTEERAFTERLEQCFEPYEWFAASETAEDQAVSARSSGL
ncbi:hypothetical protein EJ05DRAFT_490451 [Pseudovirgaria hyperparasitica]|uniref:Uncharacterized protein n=1 Tax=Pseudovirgaria hyperparasitica TaxID=470096 RepID=A0A6A6VS53_9PEZI|nr:uncharacterized protein EJ05DRAFT_490451 [Pseudovirgaria hyperparasitica]KAF2753043.1 hypothetical protein EJ05DRAFT_490451 [Pseudovirgaria hyperparasitica]